MTMHPIREARQRAGLTAAEVAVSVGRSSEWFSMVEAGVTKLTDEDERKILTAISRLERFNESVRVMKATLTHDLRLPPRPRTSRPIPGGTGPRAATAT